MELSHQWVKPFARAGYAARGVVYAIIGFFAVLAALGQSAKVDGEGALLKLLAQTPGTWVVTALIIALWGYVLWRLIQAIFDPDDHGLSLKGAVVRGSLVASAFSYGSLAVFAMSKLGWFSSGGGDDAKVAQLLVGWLGHRVVTVALALILAGVAIAHWVKAYKRKYEDHFDASAQEMEQLHPFCIVGLSGRGVVFMASAALLVYRAFYLSGEAKPPGVGATLSFVHGLPLGQLWLGLMGAGLIAFSAYSFIQAKWRRINIEQAT